MTAANIPSSDTNDSRRRFLKSASAFGAGLMVAPSYVTGQSPTSRPPNERLNIAIVGVGGRAFGLIEDLKEENLVAFCDVQKEIEQLTAFHRKPKPELLENIRTALNRGARYFQDYREMLVQMGDQIDAVVVATPDHMHYPIALSAIHHGKHVYCEKPMTHTVWEARDLTLAAQKAGVISAMGNQGHSNAGTRLVWEWVRGGVIGNVREVHSWTNRPIWPQGQGLPDHSGGSPAIPEGFDWDLWLGVAKKRPYDPAYAPFNWRAYFDFGSGAFGDMACHVMDSAYWALDLKYPDWLEAATTPLSQCAYPGQSLVTYHFPTRGNMPEVLYKWYDGKLLPPRPNMLPQSEVQNMNSGTYIIGEDALIVCDEYSSNVRIAPRNKFVELRRNLPPTSMRRIKGRHVEDWTDAIRNKRPASSNFEYAGPFTEMVQLGNIALRVGTRLEFDSTSMRFTNVPEANDLLTKRYPDGWII